MVAVRLLASASVLSLIMPASASSKEEIGQPHPARGYPTLLPHSLNESVEPFISETVEACYEQLVKHPDCCLDSKVDGTVTRTLINRSGTSWVCKQSNNCYDSWYGGAGSRGTDIVWTPASATCSSPRVLYIHGGSWNYYSPSRGGYGSFASKLASKSGAVVFAIDYPLVPIGNYWTITAASHKALVWLSKHGPRGEECAGQVPLFVGGDSSGGGSALSLVLWNLGHAPGSYNAAIQRVPLAGAFFYSPWTNLMCDTPTYYLNAFGKRKKSSQNMPEGGAYSGDIVFQAPPFDNARMYRQGALEYLQHHREFLLDKVASPFYAEAEYDGAPPMYFVVSGTESITGDTMVPASKAAERGVKVFLDIYPGMWHVFPMYEEGCGSGQPLPQAQLVLNRTALFINQESALFLEQNGVRLSCHTTSPHTALHYGPPRGYHPWMPVQPMQHPCHVVDYTGSNTLTAQKQDGGWGILASILGGAVLGAIGLLCCQGMTKSSARAKPGAGYQQQGAGAPYLE